MLGQTVTVIIDRKKGTAHPNHPDIIYPIHYGYIPGIIAPDGEEQDAYILGEQADVDTFTGVVIAIIHRLNDVETKWVVSKKNYSKREIYEKTHFQEQYFDITIEMALSTLEDVIFDLEKAGLTKTDKLMIHSGLKSLGQTEGGASTLIQGLQHVLSEGLLIFPTHTWATIREDGQVFDVQKTPSCVGALTNIALQTSDFQRSFHPTHSVCAWGKNKESYLACDLSATTPVSPTGCFGVLKDFKAKILFLGAPLSKNTFIHSIEEEMAVEDRFTEHIYHFITKDGNAFKSFYMPRHYSTKSEHISEHYEKLLPILLQRGIAKEVWIVGCKGYLIDALGCYELVKEILVRDIHAFDDFRPLETLCDTITRGDLDESN